MIPQLLILILIALNLGRDIANHKKPRKGETNAYVSLVAELITIFILYKGGFFNVFIN